MLSLIFGCFSRETTRECILQNGDSSPSSVPRNLKQAYNIQHERKEEEENHDEFYECYLFAKQYTNIVVKIDLIPQMHVVQMHPEMNLHLLSLQRKFPRLVLHYDTTFDVGPYYTSILSLRHPMFRGQPVIPVAAMFHEKTNEDAHNTFFEAVRKQINIDSKTTIIVTDREKSIVNAIKRNLPSAQNIFCWNHLRRVKT